MTGIDDRVTFPPVHKSTTSSEVLEYYSQIPSEYITRIGELYRSDFEMFGYDFFREERPLIKILPIIFPIEINNDSKQTINHFKLQRYQGGPFNRYR